MPTSPRSKQRLEIEDLLGEAILLPAVKAATGKEPKLTATDRKAGSLPNQIKAAVERQGIELPDGWKASTAIHLVSLWAEQNATVPEDILDRAAKLFAEIQDRFEHLTEPASPKGSPTGAEAPS